MVAVLGPLEVQYFMIDVSVSSKYVHLNERAPSACRVSAAPHCLRARSLSITDTSLTYCTAYSPGYRIAERRGLWGGGPFPLLKHKRPGRPTREFWGGKMVVWQPNCVMGETTKDVIASSSVVLRSKLAVSEAYCKNRFAEMRPVGSEH